MKNFKTEVKEKIRKRHRAIINTISCRYTNRLVKEFVNKLKIIKGSVYKEWKNIKKL